MKWINLIKELEIMARKNEKEIKKFRCNFCRKYMYDRVYVFEKDGTTYQTCSACKFLFLLLKEEVDSNRFHAVRRMLDYSIRNIRHCTVCKYFDPKREQKCIKGVFTGVGSSSYTFSYANDKCKYFHKLQISGTGCYF